MKRYNSEQHAGKVKRKGAYSHSKDLGWHQKHGGQVIAKAAEHAMLTGESARKFVETHPVVSDFYLLAKVDRKTQLAITREDGNEEFLERIQRYYITKKKCGGGRLRKIMQPLAKNPGVYRPIDINKGWLVWPCNDINEPGPAINREFYVQEAEKLIVR